MKKGFTLVELLVVIVIIGLISTIVYPSVMKIISSSKEEAQKSQEKVIEKAAKEWGVEHPLQLPDNPEYDQCEEDTSCVISVNDLVSGGYIDEVKDINGNLMNGYVEISFVCDAQQYTYTYYSENTGAGSCS